MSHVDVFFSFGFKLKILKQELKDKLNILYYTLKHIIVDFLFKLPQTCHLNLIRSQTTTKSIFKSLIIPANHVDLVIRNQFTPAGWLAVARRW